MNTGSDGEGEFSTAWPLVAFVTMNKKTQQKNQVWILLIYDGLKNKKNPQIWKKEKKTKHFLFASRD